jgi:hypothetical protein
VGHTYIAVSGHTISGYAFIHPIIVDGYGTANLVKDVPFDPSAKSDWTISLTNRTFNTPHTLASDEDQYSDEVTISDDGRSITEEIRSSFYPQAGVHAISTFTRTYQRIR